MKNITFALAIAAMMACASTEPASAQQKKVVQPRGGAVGWRLIGTTQAGFTADHDTIAVSGPFDDFRKIKFKVTGAALNIQRLVVTYDNGEPDKLDVSQDIAEGGESRQIDLRGAGKRKVRRIDFWYDTKGVLKGHAEVTLVGMK